jgi:hypothetical protein
MAELLNSVAMVCSAISREKSAPPVMVSQLYYCRSLAFVCNKTLDGGWGAVKKLLHGKHF